MSIWSDFGWDYTFHYGLEAMEAKAEVLMEAAVEQMENIARDMVDRDEPPIPLEQRRAACLHLCGETFDRLQQQWRIVLERRGT